MLEPNREAEITEELSQHLDDRYAELRAGGATAEQAYREALADLDDRQMLQQELRKVERAAPPEPVAWGMPGRKNMFANAWQDLRYSARMLRKSPGFTAIAVLSLALGIGANTAIFGLIDAVLLKMLPVEHPGELYFINNVGFQGGGGAPPYPCIERFRDNAHFVSDIATFNADPMKLGIDGQVEQVNGQFVSGNYFALLGVRTILGQALEPRDDSVIGIGGPAGAVAVIGYNYWRRRFGGAADVVGKTVRFGKLDVTIIGVTEPRFHGLSPGLDVDISLPMKLAEAGLLLRRDAWWFDAVARLKPDASVESASAELDAIFQGFMDESPSMSGLRHDFFDHIELEPAGRGLDTLRNPYSKPLLILMAVVGMVLLIACANVANLLLARGAARRKEFAVRLALGASRFRLIRQVLSESLLLVVLGGAAGLQLALWTSNLLLGVPTIRHQQVSLDVHLDGRLLLFTLGLSLLAAMIFGMIPALNSTRIDPGPALKENAATEANRRSPFALGKLLVVAQVALSLTLLVGAGLFVRTLRNLKTFDVGFQPSGVLTLRIDAGSRNYSVPQLTGFWQEIVDRAGGTSGVSTASLSTLSPMDGRDRGVMIDVPGFTPEEERDMAVTINSVSPDFFATMGIVRLRGRNFNQKDNASAPKVVLLNETAARFYFGDRDPIGARIRFTRPRKDEPYEVIGVVRDSRQYSMREEIPRLLYLPVIQSIDQSRPAALRLDHLTLALRTSGDPTTLIKPVTDQIREMGRDLLVSEIITLDDQVNRVLLLERLVASLSSVFGLLALLLACIGLYGVMSHDIARRTREIGIRMALGAETRAVVRLVMRDTMRMVVAGVVIGIGAALAASRLVAGLLFGLTPTDPLTIALAALLLMAVAALAGYLPARRATKVDPLIALRCE